MAHRLARQLVESYESQADVVRQRIRRAANVESPAKGDARVDDLQCDLKELQGLITEHRELVGIAGLAFRCGEVNQPRGTASVGRADALSN